MVMIIINKKSLKRNIYLLYMDDLKLFGKDDTELKGLLYTVQCITDKYWYRFRLRKNMQN